MSAAPSSEARRPRGAVPPGHRLLRVALLLECVFAAGHLGGFVVAARAARHDPALASLTAAMRAHTVSVAGFHPSILDFREYFSASFSLLLAMLAASGFVILAAEPDYRARRRLAGIHAAGMLALALLSLQFQVAQGLFSSVAIAGVAALAWWRAGGAGATGQAAPGVFVGMLLVVAARPAFAQATVLANLSAGLRSTVIDAGPLVDSLPLWDSMPLGTFAVGFRSLVVERSTTDGGRRRIRVSLWYPARGAGAARRLKLGDLFRIVLDEGQLPDARAESIERGLAVAMTGDRGALSPERARRALAALTLARRDAPASPGSFPMALWTSRHATVLAQFPLSEILASHGVIVATAWSSDPPLAFLWEARSGTDKLATIEAQTGDLEHTLPVVAGLVPADTSRILLLAWSYGGQTAARLQERLPTIRALVSLDANVIPARAEERLDLRRPLVFLYGQDSSGRCVERLDRLAVTALGARLPGLAHGNFNALEGYLPAILGADTVFRWSKGGATARAGYRAVVRMVVRVAALFLLASPPTETVVLGKLRDAAAPVPVEVSVRGSAPH